MSKKNICNIPYENRSLSTKAAPFVLAALLLTSLATSALAETRPGSYSISPFVGGYLFEGNQDLMHRPVYGVRLGYDFTVNWSAEALFGYDQTRYKITDSTTDVTNYRLEGLYHFPQNGRLVPFLAFGAGGMTIDSRDEAMDRNRAIVDYGAGLKYSLTDRMDIRADVRHILAFGSTYNNLEYTLGLTFYFGGSKVKAAATAPVQETRPAPPLIASVPFTPPAALPPSAPTNLRATPVSDSRIDLDWNSAPGATAYKIYRDGSYLAFTQATSAPDTGLMATTRYCYNVSATDDAGKESSQSNQACATTLAPVISQEAQRKEAAVATSAATTPEKPYELEDIHFDFDKFNLKAEAREILNRHAKWLNQNKEVKLAIIVEGHCDERGTAEYNLALGQRRASAAARYLIDLGVDAKRITTISYGFERPLDPRHNEEAWAKNRRAHFIVADSQDSKK